MIFAVVFGLSMGYEVFLLSLIREEWLRRGDNTRAITHGLTSSSRVITAAAAIMVCVFGSVVFGGPVRVLDVFGLGLSVAVLVDAAIARMVLASAAMQLRPTSWRVPRWLEKRRPELDVETADSSAVVCGRRRPSALEATR